MWGQTQGEVREGYQKVLELFYLVNVRSNKFEKIKSPESVGIILFGKVKLGK